MARLLCSTFPASPVLRPDDGGSSTRMLQHRVNGFGRPGSPNPSPTLPLLGGALGDSPQTWSSAPDLNRLCQFGRLDSLPGEALRIWLRGPHTRMACDDLTPRTTPEWASCLRTPLASLGLPGCVDFSAPGLLQSVGAPFLYDDCPHKKIKRRLSPKREPLVFVTDFRPPLLCGGNIECLTAACEGVLKIIFQPLR